MNFTQSELNPGPSELLILKWWPQPHAPGLVQIVWGGSVCTVSMPEIWIIQHTVTDPIQV